MNEPHHQSHPHSNVINAVSDWIASYKFDTDLKQLDEAIPLTISFKQRLLDHDLQYYFSTDSTDSVLSIFIYIDAVDIPAEKQRFIREWITYRNIEIDVGSFQMSPDSKSIYYYASIDMRGVEDIHSQFISNLYVRGRVAVATHMHEFFGCIDH